MPNVWTTKTRNAFRPSNNVLGRERVMFASIPAPMRTMGTATRLCERRARGEHLPIVSIKTVDQSKASHVSRIAAKKATY